MKLEDLQTNSAVEGILANEIVTVVNVRWFGSEALELTYKTAAGKVANEILYRHDENRLQIVKGGHPWSFDGDGAMFRLVSEAQRIRLAHLFDPLLAVHTSVVDPVPHQITAVYESMLPRQKTLLGAEKSSLMLSDGATVVGPAIIAKSLAAGAAATTGFGGLIDEGCTKNLKAALDGIEIGRTRIYKQILKGRKKSLLDYPVARAVNDAFRYHSICNLSEGRSEVDNALNEKLEETRNPGNE